MAEWGGARAGSGRKKFSESGRIPIQVSLQQHELDLLNSEAQKAGLNKSRFFVECLKFWVENHQ